MDVKLYPSHLSGVVVPPLSKSVVHRVLVMSCLCALQQGVPASELAHFWRVLGEYTFNDDTRATRDGLVQLVTHESDSPLTINCQESGSTLRFLVPVALTLGVPVRFVGTGKLPERPLQAYRDCLENDFGKKQVSFQKESSKNLPLVVRGKLTPGIYHIDGSQSSQFISGLMMALSYFGEESLIVLTKSLVSQPYVAITRELLGAFGKTVDYIEPQETYPYGAFKIQAGPLVAPAQPLQLERDWSQAAFWLVAQTMGANIEVQGLNAQSTQGDKQVVEFINQIGSQQSQQACTLSMSETPDLFPILALYAATQPHATQFTNTKRLAIKESNRLIATKNMLEALGARCEIFESQDEVVVIGTPHLKGNVEIDCARDHRIAMTGAIAGMFAQGPVTLKGAECVSKSYPDFFDELVRLGATIEVVS